MATSKRGEGSRWAWWGLAWARVEGEARVGEADWCQAGWGPVSSEPEGPSSSDPPRQG